MNRLVPALFLAAAASAMLSACGGGGAVTTPPPPPPPPPRGQLLATDAATTVSKTVIDAYDADQAMGPTRPGETASCAVTVRRIHYATPGPGRSILTASAGLLVPTGTGCSGQRPLVSIQHGTSLSAAFDAADPASDIVLMAAKYYASHGYVAVIPDYLGYGVSRAQVSVHPYLIAEADAAAVVDGMRAARQWFATSDGLASGITLASGVLLTGTSEGGYISMATQRTMERDFPSEFSIAANVAISGSYDLANEVLDDLANADAAGNSDTAAATFLLTSYQAVYGDVYTRPDTVFQPPWAAGVGGLLPSTRFGSGTQLIRACLLPFNLDTAPSPPPSCDPAPLLQPQFVADFQHSTPGKPGGIARAHIDDNDLVNPAWRPSGPLLPCYGGLDDTARMNAQAAVAALAVPAVDVQVSGPAFIVSWMVANRHAADYHGRVEAGGCTAYARYMVFDEVVPPLR